LSSNKLTNMNKDEHSTSGKKCCKWNWK